MLDIAATKVRGSVEWQRDDLLEYFDGRTDRFDRFVSTYAIHHLIPSEKELLFQRIRHAANPGARAAFGDLMFESERHRRDAIERYRSEWPDVAAAIEDEFFWIVDDCVAGAAAFRILGRDASRQRFVVGRTGDDRLKKRGGRSPLYESLVSWRLFPGAELVKHFHPIGSRVRRRSGTPEVGGSRPTPRPDEYRYRRTRCCRTQKRSSSLRPTTR